MVPSELNGPAGGPPQVLPLWWRRWLGSEEALNPTNPAHAQDDLGEDEPDDEKTGDADHQARHEPSVAATQQREALEPERQAGKGA